LIAWVQGLLAALAVEPSLANLGLAILLIGVLPLSVAVPMTAGCLAAAAALPGRLAVPVMLLGILLNTALAYGLARLLGAERLQGWLLRRGGALAFIAQASRRTPFRAAYLSRFVPAPFITAPMVAAAAGLPLRHMLLGTFLAMLPWSFGYVFVVRAGRQGSLGSIGLALGAVAVLFIGGAYLRHRAMEAKGKA
jgi:uncharacterized membrane protein YdjX (TVP38/TMEM64 family)